MPDEIDRRTFVKAATAVGLGAALGAAPSTSPSNQPLRRKRYAIVGTGARHQMYQIAMHGPHKEHAELVGLCDKNAGRLELARQRAAKAGVNVPGFATADFEKMIAQTRPDVVIVT